MEKNLKKNLERNTTYPKFGTFLEEFAKKNFPRYRFNLTKTYLMDMYDDIDVSAVYAWFRGDLCGSKPLTYFVFRDFLLKNMGKPGLRSEAKLRYLINCGPEEFYKILEDPKILVMIDELKREKKYHDIQGIDDPGGIVRQELIDEVISKIEKCNLVAILGAVGLGKKFLMRQIAWKMFQSFEIEEVIWIVDSGEATSKEQAMKMIDRSIKPYEKIYGLNNPFAPRRFLYCVENLKNANLISGLFQKMTQAKQVNFQILFTTAYVPLLANIEKQCLVVNMPKLTRTESYALAKFINIEFRDKAALQKIAGSVRHNVLGLTICLRLAVSQGLNEILSMLEKSTIDLDNDYEREIARPLRLAFETLSQSDQLRFVKMGALPYLNHYGSNVFSWLWNISAGEEVGSTTSLVHNGLLERTRSGSYQIAEQTLKYARELFGKLESAKKKSSWSWRDRGIKDLAGQLHYQEAFLDAEMQRLQEVKTDINNQPREYFVITSIKRLFIPWMYKPVQWKLIQMYSSSFDSNQYLQAYDLYLRERSWDYITRVIVWSSIALLFLPDVSITAPYYQMWAWLISAYLILLFIFMFSWARQHDVYLMMWRLLWNSRRSETNRKKK